MTVDRQRHRPTFAAALPLAFAAIGWLTAPLLAQAPTRSGKAVYDVHCVECHGTTGAGDGPAAMLLRPHPRDFTKGRYKIRSTDSGSVPSDDDLIRTIRRGLPGTAMPAFDRVLADADVRAVVGFLKSLSPQFATPAKVVAVGAEVPGSPDSMGRGQLVYDRLQCSKCHGTDGRGAGAVATEFTDDWNQPLRAADLTEPWTFHGGATARDIYLRLRTGMSGTPMPSFADAASDRDMWDLANYVTSLGRKPVWSMTAAEVEQFYARDQAAAKANPVKRGEYLVNTLGCVQCHSSYDEQERIRPGTRLAGGLLIRIEPFGDFTTGNLTSDKETGLGNWTDDEIKRVITRGTLRDGTRLLPFPMDWASFSTMTPDDLDAIVKYLRTVPPVSNKLTTVKWRPLPLYMWGKFKMLILGIDPPIAFLPTPASANGGGR
ncbi:MAG TPA: c-type cytochrome [Vicinamibacterales bacterium]|jgi:cytochrome c oxidase cbb3-type subunit 2